MNQQGSVLLISLILLLILTIAGLAAINSATLEEKITGNYKDHQIAFHAGEAALLEAERYVENTALDLTTFTSSCNNGLCFSGANPENIGTCQSYTTAPWKDLGLWEDSGRVKEVSLTIEGVLIKARYIIEFRCYLPRETQGPDPDITNTHDWARFFRITTLAGGGSDKSRVMLQSTYKKNNY
ncbi:PilX N-terminal domain-containing pilus assembly protein [Endozoicomonas sp. Mp262]|uniref:pilus assembly PilX family protein n=1 Tax=Endozoicomonas sp. Mp262 TaxID=2919499 RepID=UPI0021DB3A12